MMRISSEFEIDNGCLTKYRGVDMVVTIPAGVTCIGEGAFSCKQKLRKVILPKGLKRIEDEAFVGCSSLKVVNLSEEIEHIGEGAFWYCHNLENIDIPKGLKSVGGKAFVKTPWLDNQKGMVIVGDGILLKYEDDDREVVVPKGVRFIADEAFASCCDLERIELPEGLISIGEEAFIGCSKLKKLEVPESVTTIGRNLFCFCKLETLINHSKASVLNGEIWGCKNTYKSIKNGFLPHEDLSKIQSHFKPMVVLIYLSNIERYSEEMQARYSEYIKRAGVSLIKYFIQYDQPKAIAALLDTGMVAPKAVMKGVELARENTEMLAMLLDYLNKNVDLAAEQEKEFLLLSKMPTETEILKRLWNTKQNEDGTLTITGYKGQEEEIVVPSQIGSKKVTAIRRMAFSPHNSRYKNSEWRRKGIKSISVPEGIVAIGHGAFSGCEGLQKLELPKGVTQIGAYAFARCDKLTIYAPKGSYADKSAKRRGIRFIET